MCKLSQYETRIKLNAIPACPTTKKKICIMADKLFEHNYCDYCRDSSEGPSSNGKHKIKSYAETNPCGNNSKTCF